MIGQSKDRGDSRGCIIVPQAARPLKPEELKELDAYFKISLTYSSNAIEGNTLTNSETKVLLEDGLTAGGKPLKDSFEAIGHAKANDLYVKSSHD